MPPPTVPPIVYKNGQTESLTFPELDIFELVQFADFLVEGRTPELVMLCAHRKPEWLRSITVGTFTALDGGALDVNTAGVLAGTPGVHAQALELFTGA